MSRINVLDRDGTFSLKRAEDYNYLFFPIASEKGLKSCVTPNFGGDAKIDQESFLLEPVSAENLHNNRSSRNFWILADGKMPWSATGASASAELDKFTDKEDESEVTAGFLWHSQKRISKDLNLEAVVTSFVPYDDNVEIMLVRITNNGKKKLDFRAVSAVPIYGRSADNIRDHRNVTSMLHRIYTSEDGIVVKPTMSFDERGHRVNNTSYYVFGCEGDNQKAEGFIPTVERFIGEGGSFTHPAAIYKKDGLDNMDKAGAAYEGREACGVICFKNKELASGETANYVIMMGISDDDDEVSKITTKYGSFLKAGEAFLGTTAYWKEKANVDFKTSSAEYDNFLKWVSFQPFLRAIYGCSFLPYHDYGRGGRGWRDLWQDCLSLLIMDPSDVRGKLLNNIRGVRIDGTNATIIGSKPGEFIADRNGIARVWMDHGVWPLKTILFYIDQTGDFSLLSEMAPYFKDAQALRAEAIDEEWKQEDGTLLKTETGDIYYASVFEHLLVEHLTSYYEVGEHGILRLRGADWNDALDMAADRGESVAFSAAYAGNLYDLSQLLYKMDEMGIRKISMLKELNMLLSDDDNGLSIEDKKKVLKDYLTAVKHNVSGKKEDIDTLRLAKILEKKKDSLMKAIVDQEWIQEAEDLGWFNSYYDNNGRAVERAGVNGEDARMMLTGQVFTIMSKTADKEKTKQICKAADKYLYKKEIGGYRLNTDFHEVKLDMGRMFGFAYGEKENGAVFSHMAVMYAAALYGQGFYREGYKALQALADTAIDFDTSKIYPGIPEYFRADGRGMYHYLTGAASWYLMTMVTKAFGVRGSYGDLLIEPGLVKEQFDQKGEASISLVFAGKKIRVDYINEKMLDAGEYKISRLMFNDKEIEFDKEKVIIPREKIEQLSSNGNVLEVVLD